MGSVLTKFQKTNTEEQVLLYYVERILEHLDAGCILLARNIFKVYERSLKELLKTEHFAYIKERVNYPDDWTDEKEREWLERFYNARAFGEYKIVHDLGHEILLHHDHDPAECANHSLIGELMNILASNNVLFLEPGEVEINTFINAEVAFIVENRRSKSTSQKALEGNPGFSLIDTLGRRYRCFIKQVPNAQIGDRLQLKITNIPGLMLSDKKKSEQILYLEPRVMPGDVIEVELSNLSYTGNSFTFRFHSYDGFLWFKRKGVNKEIFNKNTLREKDRIIAKVLYTTEEEKRNKSGNISRLGIIKAIPLRRADAEPYPGENQDTDAARALS